MSFIAELKRRNVLRVAAAYVVTSWLIIQVAETVFPLFGLGDEPARITVLVLAALFVPALVLAWVFEWTPQGLKREEDVDRTQPPAHGGRRFDRIIMIVLATAVAYFAVDKFALSSVPEPTGPEPAVPAADAEPTQATGAGTTTRPMVAVLPFGAKSLDGDSEFLAAGIHDDLLTQLARLGSLRVIARTSAEAYRGSDLSVQQIGAELGADAILTGTIQSAGQRIRINTQLIDARSSEPLWAESFDRELSAAGIFDVQADISRAISRALDATLTDEESADLDVIPTENMAAYRAYHRAMQMRYGNSPTWQNPDYREALEQAVTLDPGFTRAWAELVGHLSHANFYLVLNPEEITRAEEILARLRKLAPGSVDELLAKAFFTYYTLQDFDLALQIVDRALELRPSEGRLLELKSYIQRRAGDSANRIATIEQLRELDPRNPIWTVSIVATAMALHRYDRAWREIEQTEFQSYYLAYMESLLRFRDHEDPRQLADEVGSLGEEFDSRRAAENEWDALVLARDFDAAEAILLQLSDERERNGVIYPFLSGRQSMSLVTWRLLGDEERLRAGLAEARAYIDAQRNPDGSVRQHVVYLDLGLLAALEGNREEAERMIRRYFRESDQDRAERISYWHHACRILGLAGAAGPAVACIREGLEKPSRVMPFLEPRHPAYDGIADDFVFEELLEDLGYDSRDGPPEAKPGSAVGSQQWGQSKGTECELCPFTLTPVVPGRAFTPVVPLL